MDAGRLQRSPFALATVSSCSACYPNSAQSQAFSGGLPSRSFHGLSLLHRCRFRSRDCNGRRGSGSGRGGGGVAGGRSPKVKRMSQHVVEAALVNDLAALAFTAAAAALPAYLLYFQNRGTGADSANNSALTPTPAPAPTTDISVQEAGLASLDAETLADVITVMEGVPPPATTADVIAATAGLPLLVADVIIAKTAELSLLPADAVADVITAAESVPNLPSDAGADAIAIAAIAGLPPSPPALAPPPSPPPLLGNGNGQIQIVQDDSTETSADVPDSDSSSASLSGFTELSDQFEDKFQSTNVAAIKHNDEESDWHHGIVPESRNPTDAGVINGQANDSLNSLDDRCYDTESVRKNLDSLLLKDAETNHTSNLSRSGPVVKEEEVIRESVDRNSSSQGMPSSTTPKMFIPVKDEKSSATKKNNDSSKSAISLAKGSRKSRRVVKTEDVPDVSNVRQLIDDLVSTQSNENPEVCMSLYDKLLSLGRIRDCVGLLEKMSQAGILDANKIYHTKFFNTCKEYKAVEEAFRFMRLIVNPSLRTYNMLLSVCSSAEDVEGALRAFNSLDQAGLKPDCMLYTTLLSTCAKAGNIDLLFKVFHEMVNAGIEPNVHTYGALIDGCARGGQVAKAFGVFGIMRTKKIKPDRVIFNSLINACGRSGALERAFDVLTEMNEEPIPVSPNHVTYGALMKACTHAGQVDRALDVYKMMQEQGIKGTVEAYTEAVHACSLKGDLDSALQIYDHMKNNHIRPDEVFLSALVDVAGHAKQIDAAFQIFDDFKKAGFTPAATLYSSLMGVCSNTGNWENALDLYQEIKTKKFVPTVSTFNALITALCDAGQLKRSLAILDEMQQLEARPDQITYSVLLEACEKANEFNLAFEIYTRAASEGIAPVAPICEKIVGLCARNFQELTYATFVSAPNGQRSNEKCISWALHAYRSVVSAKVKPSLKCFSHLLSCLRVPVAAAEPSFVDGAVSFYSDSKHPSLVDGCGIYDPRALTLFEEAATLGLVPYFSFMDGPIVVNTEPMSVAVAEVCMLTLLKGLKHRFAAGAKLPSVTIRLAVESETIVYTNAKEKTVTVASRTGQAISALLRKLRLSFQGNESSGKIRIAGGIIIRWLRPNNVETMESSKQSGWHFGSSPPSHTSLGKGIAEQQRLIRLGEVPQWPSSTRKSNGYSGSSSFPINDMQQWQKDNGSFHWNKNDLKERSRY